jgi:signal transduction histidine kinase
MELVETTASMSRLQCRMECPSPVTLEDKEAAGHLYRIAQEAVNNAVKHSEATRLTIFLSRRDGVLRLEVRDNGKGLPQGPTGGHGMGLQVMKHRASVIGAELEIESRVSKGVRIICKLRRQ